MTHFSRALLMIFSFMSSITVRSQQYIFKTIAPPEGGSWGLVQDIAQDVQGNMWFASLNGLYKYDGNTFTLIAPSDQNAVCVARNGYIWIGTQGSGLKRLNPETGTFTHFRNIQTDTTSLPGDHINVILEDHEGNIWVGTGDGLSRFNEKTGSFTNYLNNPSDTSSLSSNTVLALYEDGQGTLWVGTGSPFIISKEGGLNRMNKQSGTFTRYIHKDGDSSTLIDNRVSAIMEDSRGTFWVGTAGDGLHILDRSTGTFKRLQYDPAKPGKLSRSPVVKNTDPEDHITFVKQDTTGIIWIGTLQGGLSRYDPEKENIIHYYTEKINNSLVKNKMFWRSYISKDGVLWMSTWDGSLYQVDPYLKTPSFYSLGFHVNFVYEETPEILWFGTGSKGLIRKDVLNNVQKIFIHDIRNSFSISNNNVTYILKDSEQKLWIGTYGGLNRLDTGKNRFTAYKHDPGNKHSLGEDIIIVIYEDLQKNFWVGTFGGGLNLMNRETGKFTHFRHDPLDSTSISSDKIGSIYEDHKKRLWIAAWGGGLDLMNRKTGKFSHYLNTAHIASIYHDKNGTLWVGTQDGLYSLDEQSGNFTLFHQPISGKKITNVWCIIEDDKRNLWLRTAYEIIRINNTRNEVKIFGKDFGVNTILGALTDAMKGQKGNIIFADPEGYYSFFPDELTTNPNPPRLILTEMRLQDQAIKPGKNSILKEPLSETKKIHLNYRQNTFSIDFKAIDYSSRGDNHFFFLLENYDKGWRSSGADRTAGYYNVSPGKYTFHIKVSNSDGKWVEKAIQIIITPPWWRTWWAYSLYIILFITSVWSFIYYRSRALRRENLILEEKVNHRTSQLKQSLEELKSTQSQLIQSEKMASLGELTAGIAHEIQNPLNFVNNFSEVNKELLVEMKDEIEKGNLEEVKAIANDVIENEQKINHHGKRAGDIVKGMLQHSRSSTGVKEPTDINALADEYFRLAYHGLRAKDKSFTATMKTDFDESIEKINIIPQDIGRVILNLINNSFYAVDAKKKQQREGYEPTVSVTTKKIGDKVEIKVADNGNGIPQKILDKIFQPFFTTKPTGQGTGLGLSLAYDIIKAHGGEIKVETKESEGAEFVIQISNT